MQKDSRRATVGRTADPRDDPPHGDAEAIASSLGEVRPPRGCHVDSERGNKFHQNDGIRGSTLAKKPKRRERPLHFDSANSHLTAGAVDAFHRSRMQVSVIPPGATSWLQWVDVDVAARCRSEHWHAYTPHMGIRRTASETCKDQGSLGPHLSTTSTDRGRSRARRSRIRHRGCQSDRESRRGRASTSEEKGPDPYRLRATDEVLERPKERGQLAMIVP